ncbi:protein P200-like [Gambusia affinis]|uniref:protein P200-like n=1 Tax=Gambusia affinis TaxID=33528 RepID=UPI001CDCAD45|nr:protein P200-like [Gambusia affinis]XP_043994409.1 protein P200-like [Gambusia affinis]
MMETNQPKVEETEFDIIERELQLPNRPKRKRKKVPFAVWLEQQEMKTSVENIEQQEVSSVMENGSITQPLEVVDHKGDRPTHDSEPIEENLVPTKTWTEEHAPADQEISAGNIEKQNESLVSGEESTVGGQEKIEIVEKEQPSMSEEHPPRTRHNKKKKIPFSVWLETHAPVDQRISSEITGTEETSLDTKQELISVPQETTEKEQPLKSDTEKFFTENTDINNGPLLESKSLQAASPSRGNKMFWKTLPKSEPHVDITFIAENIEMENVSMAAQKSNEKASLTATQPKCTCAAKFMETELEYIKFRKYLMNQLDEMFDTNKKLSAKLKQQKDLLTKVLSERQQSRKPTVSDSQENLKQKPVSYQSVSTQTEMEEPKTSSHLKPVLKTVSTQTEMEKPETSSQLKPVFKTISTQTEMEKPETSSQLKPVFKTISTQTEMEEPETSSQLKPVLQTVSTQTEMDELETRSHWKPVCGTVSTQTEVDVLESSCLLKPVYQTISTQTELPLLLQEQSSETQQDGHQDGQTKLLKRSAGKKRRESAKKAASELETLSNETVSEANREHQGIPVPEPVGDQRAKNEIYSNETIIGKLHQATEEETICTTQQGEDQRDERKATKKSKRKNQRKAAMKAACELETVNKENVSVKNKEQEEVSMLEIVKDQRATIIIEVHKNKTVIDKLQLATEDEMVPEKQPIGDQQVEKRPLTKSKCKKKRKTAVKSEMENNLNPIVTDQNLVQNTETPKPDVETAPEIPQTALQQIEIKPVILSKDVAEPICEHPGGVKPESRHESDWTSLQRGEHG